MKARTSIALAASALLAGTAAASAAGMQQSNAGDKMAPLASDTLSLSSTQRKAAWKDLYTGSLNQKAPAGFSAVTGAVMLNTVTTAPITSKAASDVPALRPYSFAMLQHKLVIVNPADKKIAEVITR
jgi:hypothetical protein